MAPYGPRMRHTLGVVAWGVLGAVVAVALISGAFVVAGSSLTQPASAVRVATGTPLRANMQPDRHETDPSATDDAPTPSAQTTSAPTALVEPSSPATTVIRSSSVPRPTQSKDGGAEHHDD